MNMIWSHPEKFPHDWKANKVLLTGKNGYFNLATNYPQLWKEIEKLKESINIFNITRNNVKEYKTKIRSQLSIEELSEGTIKDTIKIEVSRNDLAKEDSPMVKKLRSKLSYSKTEFEKISIDAFKIDPIKEVMEIWEETDELRITREADSMLDSIKLFNPKIIGWSNAKLIRRIGENWINRKNIEEKLTDEAIEKVKTIDLSERENSDTKEFLVKDDRIKNDGEKIEVMNKETNEKIDINALRVLPSSTDLSVLTSVFDHKKGKWQESSRATHPFISVQITRIDPSN